MKPILVAALALGISVSLVGSAALAKKGYGNSRSTMQHALNTLHPTGQARARAEHALNAMPKVKTNPLIWPSVKVPPGQAKKMKVKFR
jgi:hypothetical protein